LSPIPDKRIEKKYGTEKDRGVSDTSSTGIQTSCINATKDDALITTVLRIERSASSKSLEKKLVFSDENKENLGYTTEQTKDGQSAGNDEHMDEQTTGERSSATNVATNDDLSGNLVSTSSF
jgi:hypothetical protein